MKTPTMYPAVDRHNGKRKQTAYERMEAIASGVQARFEESTGFARRVTDATISVAKSLGVSETEIERWASHRMSRLAHDTERLKEIKTLLDNLHRRPIVKSRRNHGQETANYRNQ